ncbi:MAG: alpha/beta fold hydrolase [bacterium]|nr:alpha/beta fold hydrolase [bacterium]
MRFKKTMVCLGGMALLIGGAVLPTAFSLNSRAPLVGPELSTLEYEEIEFANEDLQLAGMVFVPEGEGPFPVAVVIHGSGSSRRNSKWYLTVAEHLQGNGVAVLLPDKRGCEKSAGDWVGVGFEELAGDTLAAVEYVRRQEQFAESKVGLVGMSQGGWIAPVAAARDEDIDFVVSMSGASVTTAQQLLHEEIHNISGFTWPFIARMLAPLTSKRILNMDHVKAYADFDPIPYWNAVDSQAFFAYGEADSNVPVSDSILVLKERTMIKHIEVYPNGGHGITDPETGRIQGDFLRDLVQFIENAESRTLGG